MTAPGPARARTLSATAAGAEAAPPVTAAAATAPAVRPRASSLAINKSFARVSRPERPPSPIGRTGSPSPRTRPRPRPADNGPQGPRPSPRRSRPGRHGTTTEVAGGSRFPHGPFPTVVPAGAGVLPEKTFFTTEAQRT